MRIRQISVSGLFGMFDHTIPLNLDEHITIIHGSNGLGKTALLRLINGLFNSRYSELRNIPFREFRIDFDNEKSIHVLQKTQSSKQRRTQTHTVSEIEIQFYNSTVKTQSFELESRPDTREMTDTYWFHAVFEIPGSEKISPTERLDKSTDEVLTSELEPEWFIHLQAEVNVRFIETQRLLSLFSSHMSSRPEQRVSVGTKKYISTFLSTTFATEQTAARALAVTAYAENLANIIQGKLTEYAELSQSLDRTFPVRIVKRIQETDQNPDADISLDALRVKLNDLESKRKRLQDTGLLGEEADPTFQMPEISDATKGVLSVYVEDVEKKLSVFDNIAPKLELLKRIINDHFLYKRMIINKETGFFFVAQDGGRLLPEFLSSGEQHELILFYELLFAVKPNSLILIDEPEISLHIAWQEQFLKDLQEITRLVSLDILIATHSPQIIYDRSDLTVELTGPEN